MLVNMRFDDIRQFIDFLDHKGDLRRISEKVSPELEITEIVDRVVKDKGPALLFENVEGYDVPILINIFGSHQRMAWALGVNNINEIIRYSYSWMLYDPIKIFNCHYSKTSKCIT